MSAAGAGDKVKVQVPSPFSTAIGPAAGSHPQNGPVKRTSFAEVQTSVVIIKSCAKEVPKAQHPIMISKELFKLCNLLRIIVFNLNF